MAKEIRLYPFPFSLLHQPPAHTPTPLTHTQQVADEIWVCEDRTVKKFNGNIHDYKAQLAKKMAQLKV